MKRYAMVVVLALMWSGIANAQFKSQIDQEHPSVTGSIMRTDYNSFDLFGWFNPENFQMQHSISMSYMSMGNQTLGVNMYTNSMRYKFSDRLNIAADVSLMMSPYGSMPQGLKNQFSGFILNHAEINYRPWDDFHIQVQVNRNPFGYYNGMYGGYRSHFFSPYFGDAY
jgi:ABC-type iron transport system FetAB permease component